MLDPTERLSEPTTSLVLSDMLLSQLIQRYLVWDNGELNVKAPFDVIVESICACVYVVKTELAPHVILPVLSIVNTTAAADFFLLCIL